MSKRSRRERRRERLHAKGIVTCASWHRFSLPKRQALLTARTLSQDHREVRRFGEWFARWTRDGLEVVRF